LFFSAQAIAEMAAAYQGLDGKEDRLLTALLSHKFKNETSKEFAAHGVARRLRTLTTCIKNVFNALPPESETLPTRDDLIEATINIQAFILNAAGLMDNLAWIWVHENPVKNRDGLVLKKKQISLTNRAVRKSFSTEFKKYVNEQKKWIENLHTFRDSLAHRIPLYISPYQLPADNSAAYFEFDRLKEQAATSDESNKLDAEQKKLVVFQPMIRHSLYEKGSYSIMFHPQLFADFNTIEELANKFLVELDAPFTTPPLSGNKLSRTLKRLIRRLASVLNHLAR